MDSFSKKLEEVNRELDSILELIEEYEKRYKNFIVNVHPKHAKSVKNFVHYLAVRSVNLVQFQKKLEATGLYFYPTSTNAVLHYILNLKSIINRMLQKEQEDHNLSFLTPAEARIIHKKNAIALFGFKKNNRKTSIMVTQPTIAATDRQFTKKLLKSGINCVRINCAHDDKNVWEKIIENIKEEDPDCKIIMDLAGPKLRTGEMKPQSKIIHISPKKTADKKKKTAKIWLIPSGKIHKVGQKANAIIQVNNKWLKKTQPGDYLTFIDAKGKNRKIEITEIEGNGRWGVCHKSAYITTGTLINVFFKGKENAEEHTFHEFYTLDNFISLKKGDFLSLTKNNIPGEPAIYSPKQKLIKPAHISCTLPQIFDFVNVGEPIFFDEGKIEGVIKEKDDERILVKIVYPLKDKKLRANKGINLPKSKLKIEGLTQKDKNDLRFVTQHANTVNFSFVNNRQDVENLLNEIKKIKKPMGVVLKIETVEALSKPSRNYI